MLDYDAALTRIARTHPEYSSGGFDTLSNHAPMAAEALVALGQEHYLEPYLERVLPTLRPMPPTRPRELGWEARLRAPIPDAIAAFEFELRDGPWQDVVNSALPRLLPGMIAGAFHGWLRVAHAVRALGRDDTEARRRELAHGLGYWAARFETLPGEPGQQPESGLDPLRALDLVVDTSEAAKGVGLIVDRALLVRSDASFASLASRVDFSTEDHSDAIGSLACAAARLYLDRPGNGFSYLHAVTATSALRLIEPVVDQQTRARAFRYVWQAIAAVHASGRPGTPTRTQPVDPTKLPEQAARSLDDHTIKLSEALLREHAIAPSSLLMETAAAELSRRGRG